MKKKVVQKKPRKKIKHEIWTGYLGSIFGAGYLKMVPAAAKKLRAIQKTHPFDAIAFTGTSGAGIAFPLSLLLKLPLIHVRKKNVKSHYSDTIEGTISSKRYLIVDDFIASGATVNRIISTIKKDKNLKKAKAVGIFLYDSTRSTQYKRMPVFNLMP
jgi:adenine/guanine phosphoribosyltransferase-like PRPP-binding protein